METKECYECAKKPGTPTLCEQCLWVRENYKPKKYILDLLVYKPRAVGMYDEDRKAEEDIVNKINQIIKHLTQ